MSLLLTWFEPLVRRQTGEGGVYRVGESTVQTSTYDLLTEAFCSSEKGGSRFVDEPRKLPNLNASNINLIATNSNLMLMALAMLMAMLMLMPIAVAMLMVMVLAFHLVTCGNTNGNGYAHDNGCGMPFTL